MKISGRKKIIPHCVVASWCSKIILVRWDEETDLTPRCKDAKGNIYCLKNNNIAIYGVLKGKQEKYRDDDVKRRNISIKVCYFMSIYRVRM